MRHFLAFLVLLAPLCAAASDDRYVSAARALQSMPDEEFAAAYPKLGATRLEALAAVYRRLAEDQYERSRAAAEDQAKKARVDAELERVRPAVAATEKAGWWSEISASVSKWGQEPRETVAVAAVRGGRELTVMAQQQDSLLKNLADTASDKCSLYEESGRLYEKMAETASGEDFKPLKRASDRLLAMSDEEYDSSIRNLGAQPLPPRMTSLSNLYARLAKVQLERSRAQAAEDAKRKAALDAAMARLRPALEGAEKTGWLSSFSSYLNSQPAYHSDVEAAVAAVRGGRGLKSDAERELARLSKDQDALLDDLTKGHDEAELYQQSGELYQKMSAVAGATAPGAAKEVSSAPGVSLTPREIYQRAGPAVVFVFGASDAGGEIGTGSVIDATHVLTNAHVVIREKSGEAWPSIRVYLKPAKVTGDNKRDLKDPIQARVVRFDRALDLALLELQDAPSGLTVVPIGDSALASPGDPVVAIGHPEQGGLWTLTQGVIGTILADFDKVPGKDVFQTDASINRGNSGGPLLARDGTLVGVNTAMSRRAADGMAITAVNFSIQSNVVKRWLAEGDVKVALNTAPVKPAAESDAGLVTVKEQPKIVAELPKPSPAPTPEKKTILTPAKPYRAEELIEQEMRQMDDLSKEMQQEVERVRARGQ